jgi:hypothetical protein
MHGESVALRSPVIDVAEGRFCVAEIQELVFDARTTGELAWKEVPVNLTALVQLRFRLRPNSLSICTVEVENPPNTDYWVTFKIISK